MTIAVTETMIDELYSSFENGLFNALMATPSTQLTLGSSGSCCGPKSWYMPSAKLTAAATVIEVSILIRSLGSNKRFRTGQDNQYSIVEGLPEKPQEAL